ncbi:MAG: TraX family protein [Eubacterium sp.]|jgi:hypothetical protein
MEETAQNTQNTQTVQTVQTAQTAQNAQNNEAIRRGLSSKAIKWIAMVTMAVDHTAVAIIETLFYYGQNEVSASVFLVYEVMRDIGRLAFPLFIYLLVEGFFRTHSRAQYLSGMLIFSAISEIPFDLALTLGPDSAAAGVFIESTHQNIYFTLSIGLLCMVVAERIFIGTGRANPALQVIVACLVAAGGGALAELIKADYGAVGVIAIVAAYMMRRNKLSDLELPAAVGVLLFSNLTEGYAIADCFFVHASNGLRGNIKYKWLYYIFYPAHLAILALLKYLIFA